MAFTDICLLQRLEYYYTILHHECLSQIQVPYSNYYNNSVVSHEILTTFFNFFNTFPTLMFCHAGVAKERQQRI